MSEPWCEADGCPASVCGGPHVTRMSHGREATEHVDHAGEVIPPESPENVGAEMHYVYDSDGCRAEDGQPPPEQLDAGQGRG